MLKLFIVDDEEIICEALSHIIDWNAYDIQLIGTCHDGVEAYHTILDECPDIVMTDIRMPGISGLELIERISRSDLCTQFVILSGYGEFDYAQRAMKCGVRHYLLKPCTEEQIITCIQDVTRDYYQALAVKEQQMNKNNRIQKSLHQELIRNMIREGLAAASINASSFEFYEHYMNLTSLPYQFCCVYYLEEQNLSACLTAFDQFQKRFMPDTMIHRIYIQNILIFFFADFDFHYELLEQFFLMLSLPEQSVSIEYSRTQYSDLKSLLTSLIQKLKRYDVLYFVEQTDLIPNFNYTSIIQKTNDLIPLLASDDTQKRTQTFDTLLELLTSVSNREFLLQLSDTILISLGTKLPSSTLPEITDFLYRLHNENDTSKIITLLMDYLSKLTDLKEKANKTYSPFIAKLIDYLNEHYSDSSLTLKSISENYLYMNVSYVSRCFTRETGEKFSSFLMNLRVQKAKELLGTNDSEKIQCVAELVGCGNTPYYFSKIFKKCTGLTPSAYVKKMNQGIQ